MDCTCNYVLGGGVGLNPESVNEKILNNIQLFQPSARKVLRLLAKQFIILEVGFDEDIPLSGERYLISGQTTILYYRDFEGCRFEWSFNTREL